MQDEVMIVRKLRQYREQIRARYERGKDEGLGDRGQVIEEDELWAVTAKSLGKQEVLDAVNEIPAENLSISSRIVRLLLNHVPYFYKIYLFLLSIVQKIGITIPFELEISNLVVMDFASRIEQLDGAKEDAVDKAQFIIRDLNNLVDGWKKIENEKFRSVASLSFLLTEKLQDIWQVTIGRSNEASDLSYKLGELVEKIVPFVSEEQTFSLFKDLVIHELDFHIKRSSLPSTGLSSSLLSRFSKKSSVTLQDYYNWRIASAIETLSKRIPPKYFPV